MAGNDFVRALEQNDRAQVMLAPKGDLHNHAPRGGNIAFIERWAGVHIPRLEHKFADLAEMQDWYSQNIRCYCIGIAGYEIRIQAAFERAKNDGVTKLVLSFGLGEEAPYGSLRNFLQKIEQIHQSTAPMVEYKPELSLDRASDVSAILPICEEYICSGLFYSIDICGNELAEDIRKFKPIYRAAKSAGMRLRAHAGEFGSADSVREAVEELDLDEVQHGIAAARCKHTSRWLADHKIQLNVCPASNIVLSLADNYKTHPIRVLFDSGIKVTINTDDMLIFNASISDMFAVLHSEGAVSAAELDIIRTNSLG